MPLTTGSCIVRPWRNSDLESLVTHANNRNVWLQLRDRLPHPYTKADGKAWITYANSEAIITNFAMQYQGKAVGSIGLTLQNDIEQGTAEVGYWLGEPFWGKGLTSSVLRIFAQWAFERFQLRRLFAMTLVDNLGSRRVLEKTGFQLEGILRQHAIKAGVVQDQAFFGLLRDELQLH